MRTMLGAIGVILLAGCGTPRRQEDAVTRDEFTNLEAKVAQNRDGSVLVQGELADRLGKLEQRLTTMENLLKTYDVDLRRLNDKVDRLTAASGAGAPAGPAPGPNPGLTVEQALELADAQILRLKQGMRQEDVVQALLPISRHAVPRLCEALKTSLRDIEFMRRLEFVLSRMPAEDLSIPISDALKDGAGRYPAVRVIGEVGNIELSKLLEPFTGSADLDFCYSVGYSLVRCRNRAGVPALIRSLRAEDQYTRSLAISSLRSLNKDETFGFDVKKTAEGNDAAIKAWENWCEKEASKLFE